MSLQRSCTGLGRAPCTLRRRRPGWSPPGTVRGVADRRTAALGQWFLGSLSPCVHRRGDLAPKLVGQCTEGRRSQGGGEDAALELCSASSPVPKEGAGAGSERCRLLLS